MALLLAQQQSTNSFTHMQLAEYLKQSGQTWERLADSARVSRQTVWNLLHKNHNPTLTTVDRVVAATGGLVTIDDLRKPT